MGITDKIKSDSAPKVVFKEYEIQVKSDGVHFPGGIVFRGKSIADHLKECGKCAVMAATLGHETDRVIRGLMHTDMALAVAYDGGANSLIEEICDGAQREIEVRLKKDGFFITARFSPGYGDFSLDNQPAMLKLSNAAAGAGITLSENNLLLPQKSVTAVIGYRCEPAGHADKCKTCPSAFKCAKKETKYEA